MVHGELGALPTFGLREALAWGMGRRVRYLVSGASMAPTLLAGDWVFVSQQFVKTNALNHAVIVASHPFQADVLLIKRVVACTEAGVTLMGDNPRASTDSDVLGIIPWSHVKGRVTCRWPQ